MKKILKIFSFTGEATRKEWWIVQISFVVFMLGMITLDGAILKGDDQGTIYAISLLASIWPMLATDIRRWANRGKSPVWILINFIPVIGRLWVTVELGFMPAKKQDPWLSK